MVLGLRPSTRAINEISVGAIKQMPSNENSVGAINKDLVGAINENSVGARSTSNSKIYPIQCNDDYSGPSG